MKCNNAKLALNSTVKPQPIPASDFKPYINQYISQDKRMVKIMEFFSK